MFWIASEPSSECQAVWSASVFCAAASAVAALAARVVAAWSVSRSTSILLWAVSSSTCTSTACAFFEFSWIRRPSSVAAAASASAGIAAFASCCLAAAICVLSFAMSEAVVSRSLWAASSPLWSVANAVCASVWACVAASRSEVAKSSSVAIEPSYWAGTGNGRPLFSYSRRSERSRWARRITSPSAAARKPAATAALRIRPPTSG
jgi:hypothetical protein